MTKTGKIFVNFKKNAKIVTNRLLVLVMNVLS